MRKLAVSIVLATLAAAAGLATRDEWPAWATGGARALVAAPLPEVEGMALSPSRKAIILCQGDSNVRGSGGSRPWGRSEPVRPWCDWLASALGTRAINRGVGGDTVAMGLARNATDGRADLVFLLYGANDAAARGLIGARRPIPLDAFKADLAVMVRQHGASRVLVLAALPAGSRAADRRIAPYRRAAREVALAEGAAFIDPAEALGSGTAVLDWDGLHLNREGHRRLGLWLAERLKPHPGASIAP